MATEVRVPTTGNAGEAAVVLDWNVAVGSHVAAGDILASLETAKAVMEVDAPVSGVVLDIKFAEGDEAPEHDVLLIIGEAGESVLMGPTVAASSPASAVPDTSDPPAVVGQGEEGTPAPSAPRNARISISPRARRFATERGIDIAALRGTGPFGRIVIADIEAAGVGGPSPATEKAEPRIAPTPRPQPSTAERTVLPVRGARKVTAQRMHASLQESAQLTLTRYAEADRLLAYAARLKEVTEQSGRPKVSVNDLLLFATARAVVKHPAANSWFAWDGITQFSVVHLGFAVDTDQALLVPVIRNADTLGLSALADQTRGAIERARTGKTTANEMSGGTFTVSNLGGLGVHWFTPVLDPPQTGILGVGAAHRAYPDAPALLPLSLTFDHRAIDGATAALPPRRDRVGDRAGRHPSGILSRISP